MFRCAALIVALAVCASAQATIIEFETELLSGQRFRTTYTVTNDSLSVPLRLFDIEFDVSRYDELSLTPVSGPHVAGAWSEIILSSAPGVPAMYDAFALGTGIAPGATFGGFTVEFDWLGALADAFDATQAFLVYDATTLELLETATTRLPTVSEPPPAQVSEPGTLAALLAGLVTLIAVKIRSARFARHARRPAC